MKFSLFNLYYQDIPNDNNYIFLGLKAVTDIR